MTFNNIHVVGAGYVGLSLAAALSSFAKVTLIDIDSEKLDSLRKEQFPMSEQALCNQLILNKNNITYTDNIKHSISSADIFFLCLPTNFSEKTNSFNVSILDEVILMINKDSNYSKAPIVIKSTVPIGYTDSIQEITKNNNIIFSPEFLREGSSFYDHQYPSRIIVGDKRNIGKEVANLLTKTAKKKPQIFLTSSVSAEAMKLFSNSFLAMRVAYFNEVDSFCIEHGIDSYDVIRGISADSRIGAYYNNPSFGYGGYCLPKDTRQLLSSYGDIPQALISAIVESNTVRINFLSKIINELPGKTIGIYRLQMKAGSDNFRESATLSIINKLSNTDKQILIYEPLIKKLSYNGLTIINNLQEFKGISDVIVANRIDKHLFDVKKKIFSRDIFYEN